MSSSRIMLWLGVVLGAFAVIGCSSETDPPAAATILSFQSSPAEIEAGRSATLAWATENAKRIEIVEVGGGPISLGDAPAASGSVQVSPAETTSYELRAYGKGKGVASRVAIVNVIPANQGPKIVSFVADPVAIGFGDDVQLSWMTANADTVRIVDATGTPVAVANGEQAAQGQVVFKPRGSSTYHLLATGPAGQAEGEVAVSVHGLPTVTLTVSDRVVEPGGITTLHWSATRANRVIISDDSGVVYEGTQLEGQLELRPEFSSTFTAVARGEVSEGSARANVSVRPVIDLFEVRAAGLVYPGEEVELRWRVRGARELTVTRLGLDPWVVPEASLTEGSVRLPVGVDGNFRLRARSGSLLTEGFAPVPMQPVPRIVEIGVSPAEVTADEGHAAEVTISWFIDAARRIELTKEDGETIKVSHLSPRKDSVAVEVNGPTTFRLAAFNDHGQVVAEKAIVAHRRAAIDTFVALPSVAAVGESVTVFWEASDAATVSIEKVGEGILANNLPGAAGSFANVIQAEAAYVLRAYNAVGFETVSEPVEVSIGDPVIQEFVGDRFYVRPGIPVTLSWSNVGGQALAITDSSGAVVADVDGNPCSTTDLFRIVEGSCVVPGPAVGEHTYTLRLENGLSPATAVTATVDIESVSGPVVVSFEVDGPATVGRPVSMRWENTEDIAGNGALIELSVDGQVFHTTTTRALQGSAQHVFTSPGVFPVVIRAHSDEGDHRLTRSAEIRGEVVIESFAANPTELDSSIGESSTTLAWTWRNGWEAKVYKVDAEGALIEPPVAILEDANHQGPGSFSIEPGPGIHEFALVVDNLAGSTAEARGAHVVADRAKATIEVSQAATMPGDDMVTVSWETQHATHVHITPSALSAANLHTVQEISTRFVDISTLPGVRQHNVSTDDTGFAEVVFPEGYSFPFDGVARKAARAWVDGVLSFNVAGSSGGSNVRLPASSGTGLNAHMALFWDDLHVERPGHSRARILSALSADEKGPFFAVQWSGVQPYAAASHPANLNFQVILRPDGSFEYRYGTMTTANNLNQGAASTVGFQNYLGTAGFTLNFDTAMTGGFSNRSWSFTPPSTTPSGSMNVKMAQTTDFTVWARNDFSSDTDTDRVVFWNAPTLSLSAAAEVNVGDDFNLVWSASEVTQVEIVDGEGVVLCSQTSPDGAAMAMSGTCVVRENAVGEYTYTQRVVGGLPANSAERTVTVKVYQPLELDFTVSAPWVLPGETVTLDWESVGAVAWNLKADGVDVAIPQTASGTLALSPAKTTTYELTATDAPGAGLPTRTRTISHTVTVRTNTLDRASISPQQAISGTGPYSVTVTWNSSNADGVSINDTSEVESLPGPSRFADIRGSSTVQTLTRSNGNADEGGYIFNLPTGFNFTYDGERVTTVTASSNGWLSFSSVTSGFVFSNVAIPSATNSKIQLAPFWDDLNTNNMYLDQGTDAEFGRYVVIQWDSIVNSSTSGSLEFQVLLYESGWFEFRYGNMTASQTGRADGSSATIGFQNRTGSDGYQIHKDSAIAGGMSGKNFLVRTSMATSGSKTFEVTETTDFVICSFDSSHRDCQTITFTVVGAGDVLFTEIMPDPANGVEGQWLEVRNVSRGPIDLEGMVLEGADGATHTINQSIRLLPGEYAVLARGDETVNGGAGADYVYGVDVPFAAAAGAVGLKYGPLTLDTVTWDATWDLPAGKSIALDGSYHLPAGGNSVRMRWCESSEAMSGGSMGTPGYSGKGCHNEWYTAEWMSDRPFIDISTTGETIAKLNVDTAYDGAADGRPIGFEFPFFGGRYTTWYGSSNGLISVLPLPDSATTNSSTWPNTANPNGVIAGFWDDLTTGTSVTTQLLLKDGQRVRIVQWTGSKISGQTTSGAITFQIQLWENGDIVMAYKDIRYTTATARDRYLGSSASVGIENATGSAGIAFMLNKALLFEGRVLAFEAKD